MASLQPVMRDWWLTRGHRTSPLLSVWQATLFAHHGAAAWQLHNKSWWPASRLLDTAFQRHTCIRQRWYCRAVCCGWAAHSPVQDHADLLPARQERLPTVAVHQHSSCSGTYRRCTTCEWFARPWTSHTLSALPLPESAGSNPANQPAVRLIAEIVMFRTYLSRYRQPNAKTHSRSAHSEYLKRRHRNPTCWKSCHNCAKRMDRFRLAVSRAY